MKVSNYNFTWPSLTKENTSIIYNSLTNSLLEIGNQYLSLLDDKTLNNINRNLSSEEKGILDHLERDGIIVEDKIKELDILKYLFDSNKYDRTILTLTIGPTLGCNFACPYCIEQSSLEDEIGHSIMDESVQENIVTYIEDRAPVLRSISINWFGGEPLLAKDVIYSLSKKIIAITEKYDIIYRATIVTNGYLFNLDSNELKSLKESKISKVQITVDGPPEIHNKRRILSKSKKGTFDKIFKNIHVLKDNGIIPSVRVNVDRENHNDALKILDIFAESNLLDIPINLGFVQPDTDGCQKIEDICLSVKEFSDLQKEFYSILRNKNFKIGLNGRYPSLGSPCEANRVGSLVVDPDGDLYKCRAHIGDKSKIIGNIDKRLRTNVERAREINWIAWEPFLKEKCKDCKYLPICFGQCSNRDMRRGKPVCTDWKYSLKHYVQEVYTEKISKKGG